MDRQFGCAGAVLAVTPGALAVLPAGPVPTGRAGVGAGPAAQELGHRCRTTFAHVFDSTLSVAVWQHLSTDCPIQDRR